MARRACSFVAKPGVARPVERVETTEKTTLGPITWLGVGCSDGKAGKRRDLSGVCEPGRSKNPHSTAAAAAEKPSRERPGEHKPVRGKGGRKGEARVSEPKQQTAGSAEEATQGGEAARDFSWVEASVWTERMLSALVNGVKGGKWYALMDKVFALDTLTAARAKVKANQGAAGVDGQSIERFVGQRRMSILPSCRRRCGRVRTARKRSNGLKSRRAMARRGRWASQRSRIASSSRRSGS
jgi:hypothetical protein